MALLVTPVLPIGIPPENIENKSCQKPNDDFGKYHFITSLISIERYSHVI